MGMVRQYIGVLWGCDGNGGKCCSNREGMESKFGMQDAKRD